MPLEGDPKRGTTPSTYIHVRHRGKDLSALVDHGAELSLISEKTCLFLGVQPRKLNCAREIKLATDKLDTVNRFVLLNLEIAGKIVSDCHFHVCNDVSSGLLLGMNLIRALTLVVHPHSTNPARNNNTNHNRKRADSCFSV